MRPTRLVLVEGLPGSGKSTLAQRLAIECRRQGVPARWVYEQEVPHPVAGSYRPEARPLVRWRAFVEAIQAAEYVTVLDGAFLQHPVMALLTAGVDPDEIMTFLEALAKVARPLDPVLVYLTPGAAGEALRVICARRGWVWTLSHIQRNDATPFARRRSVGGFAGLLRYWQEHAEVCDGAVRALGLPTIEVSVAPDDGRRRLLEVGTFLGLPVAADEARPPERELVRYVGTYRRSDGVDRRELSIELRDGRLLLRAVLWPGNPLIPWGRNAFIVEAWPFELIFDETPDGAIHSFRVARGRVTWGTIEGVFERVGGRVSD